MKVGFFSPLPPAPTGVADYSQALLTALRKLGTVEVGGESADVALYHLGNNHLHREIYRRAVEHPGVAVLHDAVLNHFFLGTLSEEEYVAEFVHNYGEWSRSEAQDLWRNRARSASDSRYFARPMLKRPAERSKAVIVHNPGARNTVLRHSPQTPVHEIPHLFLDPKAPSESEVQAFREREGIGPETLLVGVFGHLRESKRISVILRAMERLWAGGADAMLLVQGSFASTDLDRALRPQLENPRILRKGFLEEPDFWRWAAATDVCLNLRWPSANETSGIAVSMMGIGRTVMFTQGEEISRLPENACLRVGIGPEEDAAISSLLGWLAENPGIAPEIGKRAAAHIRSQHSLDRVAGMYWKVLQQTSVLTS